MPETKNDNIVYDNPEYTAFAQRERDKQNAWTK
jgi:hypothetical protein